MIVDTLTCKMQDYLSVNNLRYTLTSKHLIIDLEGLTLAFVIYDNKITTRTSPDLSLAYEPYLKRFENIKIKLQGFILDNEILINQLIALSFNYKMIGEE